MNVDLLFSIFLVDLIGVSSSLDSSILSSSAECVCEIQDVEDIDFFVVDCLSLFGALLVSLLLKLSFNWSINSSLSILSTSIDRLSDGLFIDSSDELFISVFLWIADLIIL